MISRHLPTLTLQPVSRNRRPRILSGHVWAYRSELKIPHDVGVGAIVDLCDTRGAFIARGYVNPQSEIAFRCMSRTRENIDVDFFRRELHRAQENRTTHGLAGEPHRLIFSEGDLLPGFIVDRYANVLVVALTTAGADLLRDSFLAALRAEFPDCSIIERSDSSIRGKEGLPAFNHVHHGDVPERVACEFDGIPVSVDVHRGQKTGAFLDAREMRRHLRAHAHNARVLDCFSHIGLFTRYAAAGGARELTAVDVDDHALAALKTDLPQTHTECTNAFDLLRAYAAERRAFECVVIDPPPFTKSARAKEGAARGYKEILLRGLQLTAPGGLLYASSCSFHISREEFVMIARDAAADAGRMATLEGIYTAAPDHPIILTIPETDYFKGIILRVM